MATFMFPTVTPSVNGSWGASKSRASPRPRTQCRPTSRCSAAAKPVTSRPTLRTIQASRPNGAPVNGARSRIDEGGYR